MSFLINYPAQAGREGILASLRSADFNSTADQTISIRAAINFTNTPKFLITKILITNATVSLSTVQGGFYTATSKGGTALVSASQAYSSLTTDTILLEATLAGSVATTMLTLNNIYLSLTTPQGSAALADVYVVGIDLQ